MTFSQHIAAGSLLSKLTGNPIAGFVIGFASHAILDLLPIDDHKINMFDIDADKDIVILEVILSVIMLIFSIGNWIMFMTILGAMLPDLIDAVLSAQSPKRYQRGIHLFWFHRPSNGRTELSKGTTMIISIVLFCLILIL